MKLEGVPLLEHVTYSKKEMAILAGFLILPAVITFFGYLLHHDHIIVMIEVVLLAYALPCFIIHQFIDKTLWVKATTNDMQGDRKARARNMFVMGGFIGAIFGGILIIWSKFVPFGPFSIVLQMPYYANFISETFYWIGFSILWVGILPVAEVGFYFVIQETAWKNTWSKFMISGCYSLMNFAWLVLVVGDIWAILILTGVTYGLGLLLVYIKESKSGMQAAGIRMGIAAGILALLVFLNFVYPAVQRPYLYSRGHESNSFRY